MLRPFTRPCLALTAALVLLPAAAHAATITGSPLSITSEDSSGRLGVGFTGSSSQEFCCGTPDAQGLPSPNNAGFVVTVLEPSSGTTLYGSRTGNVEASSAPVVTGTGTAANPFKLSATFLGKDVNGAPRVQIAQVLTYVNGQSEFLAHYDVTNVTAGERIPFRASMGADLYGGGSDRGVGLFEPGPPRLVAGLNPSSGAIAGLVEKTAWSHFEEGSYSSVLSRASGDPRVTGQSLQDLVDPTEVDDGAAVQWDQNAGSPLSPGQAASFEVVWRFVRTLDVTPIAQTATSSTPVRFAIHLTDSRGAARGGVPIVYSISGSNVLNGKVTTAADGSASIEYVPASPGSDSVTLFADLNGNGNQDQGEPTRDDLRVTVEGPQPPVFGQSVNVQPAEGTVKVKLPKGFQGKARSAWARKAASGFVKLDTARQIPVGSQLDVSRGRVQLASATTGVATSQTIQSSAFSPCPSDALVDKKGCKALTSGRVTRFASGDSSTFLTLQPKSGKGLTEIAMAGNLSCPKGSGRKVVAAAKTRSRSLWSNGRGRFRTRGRNSSATVRGTEWFQKDTCSSTETRVRRGTVTVKDFAKGKNVTVKEGKRYIARPKKR